MFKKVLVAIDGESGGHDAYALARQLVDDGGEIVQAFVELIFVGKGGAGPTTGWHPELEHQPADPAGAPDRVDEHAKMLTIAATSIGRGLHVLAEREHADLLVVGSTRHGIVGRILLGDHTNEAINGAPCAVAIAPAAYAGESHRLRSIGVAYNGSADSDHALTMARELASACDAKLSAMEVVRFPTTLYTASMARDRDVAGPMVEEARRRIEQLGGVDARAAYGDVADELAYYSGDLDLLVIASRAYGPAGRLVHSSTSRHLARTSHCPLLILTRPVDSGAENPAPAASESVAA